jgi:hypothetical protein
MKTKKNVLLAIALVLILLIGSLIEYKFLQEENVTLKAQSEFEKEQLFIEYHNTNNSINF